MSDEPQEAPAGTQRVAVVTGGARGIGAETARRLASDGLAVAVLDLKEGDCGDTVDAITAAGGRALAVGADVSDTEQVKAAVAEVAAQLGPPFAVSISRSRRAKWWDSWGSPGRGRASFCVRSSVSSRLLAR